MTERASVNVSTQWGVESTPGTNVAATKLLRCFMLTTGVKPEVKTYRGTGRRFPSVQAENREWVEGTISGDLDYQGSVYLISGPWGGATITTPTNGINARSWVFAPPLTGSITPKTYTIEQGDSVRAHKFNYGLFTGFGYKVTRQEATNDAALVAQLLQDNITMTSSPTAISLQPVVGKQINVFIDTTSANIGTTQYTRNFSLEFKYDAGFGTFWPLNRSSTSFTGHVDLVPKNTVKLRLEADSQGMGLLSHLQNGDYLYVRVDALGPVIDNIQLVSLGSPSAGTFTLTYKGQTTSGIAYNATTATVQTALQGLSTIGSGNATVSGSTGGPYTVTFAGTLANDTTALTGSGSGLTGGTFVITQEQIYYEFTHDIAIKLTNTSPFADDAGIYCIDYDGEVFEDTSWNSGQSQKLTIVNALTGL